MQTLLSSSYCSRATLEIGWVVLRDRLNSGLGCGQVIRHDVFHLSLCHTHTYTHTHRDTAHAPDRSREGGDRAPSAI